MERGRKEARSTPPSPYIKTEILNLSNFLFRIKPEV